LFFICFFPQAGRPRHRNESSWRASVTRALSLLVSNEHFIKSLLAVAFLKFRNASAPGAISLRSMAPAKAAYAVIGIVFSNTQLYKSNYHFFSIHFPPPTIHFVNPPYEICVKKIKE
jgi:hypothetical protein